MGSIFISYRRQDSAAYAGRLYDRLAERFGAENVFMDIDSINPGTDFVDVLAKKIRFCQVMLVVVGPDWVSLRAENEKLRLSDPDDYVRQEIAMGLQRKIRLIPLLVSGAKMPAEKELPNQLSALARRQAVVISDVHFHRDVDAVIETMQKSGFPASEDIDINGDWRAEAESRSGQTYNINMHFEQLNDRIFGWVRYPTGQGNIMDGRLEGNVLSFKTEHIPQFEQDKATINFQGTISGQEIEFIMHSADSYAKFRATKKLK
jgi:hypothetical protein